MSLLGEVELSRPYYYCTQCGQSQRPWDDALRLGPQALTPAASQVVSQAGLLTSFAEASEETLRTMSGLRVSESTVERTTETTGERVAAQLAAGQTQGPKEAWEWQRDAQGRTVAYVGCDHTGIRQQGPGGRRAEGKMAAVAMVYNPRSEHDDRRPKPRQVRYLAGFLDLRELGRRLRREAEAVGIMQAEVIVALSDCGQGMEELLRTYFPRAVVIADFWHAKEYLVELSLALHPQDQAARQAWQDEWCHRLKHEGGQAALACLEALPRDDWSAAALEAHRKAATYFRNHHHKMDYPTYVANGWQIGSGPVESACKTVVGNRLKGGGMRWGSPGSNAVCHLRAAYLSQPACWQALWSSA